MQCCGIWATIAAEGVYCVRPVSMTSNGVNGAQGDTPVMTCYQPRFTTPPTICMLFQVVPGGMLAK